MNSFADLCFTTYFSSTNQPTKKVFYPHYSARGISLTTSLPGVARGHGVRGEPPVLVLPEHEGLLVLRGHDGVQPGPRAQVPSSTLDNIFLQARNNYNLIDPERLSHVSFSQCWISGIFSRATWSLLSTLLNSHCKILCHPFFYSVMLC